ncbi:MAG: hypothetical protein II067_04150, partial [Agathobacter sp.]|uniref:hypothetical protein n=1 Tax=Agathobacter sp. TaxID=2021311 RepID=UPI00257EE0DE
IEYSKAASLFYLANGQCSVPVYIGQESDLKHFKVFAMKRQFVEVQNRGKNNLLKQARAVGIRQAG